MRANSGASCVVSLIHSAYNIDQTDGIYIPDARCIWIITYAQRVACQGQNIANTQGMSTPIWSAGADFWDADGKKSLVNTPEFVDALQQQIDMTLTDKSTPLPADASAQNGPGFVNKRVASLLTGPHFSRAVDETADKVNITQVPVPKGKGGRQALALVNSFYLTSVGKNRDQAWLLYKHLLSPETQKAVVPLGMKNNFTEKVESARAVCFLLNEQGKVVGQSTK